MVCLQIVLANGEDLKGEGFIVSKERDGRDPVVGGDVVSVDQEETWEGHWKDGTLAKLNEFLGLQSKVTKRRLQIFFT